MSDGPPLPPKNSRRGSSAGLTSSLPTSAMPAPSLRLQRSNSSSGLSPGGVAGSARRSTAETEALMREHKGNLHAFVLDTAANVDARWDEGFFRAELASVRVRALAPAQEQWLDGLASGLALDRDALLLGPNLHAMSQAVDPAQLPDLAATLISFCGTARLAALARAAVEGHLSHLTEQTALFFGARTPDLFALLLERWLEVSADAFLESVLPLRVWRPLQTGVDVAAAALGRVSDVEVPQSVLFLLRCVRECLSSVPACNRHAGREVEIFAGLLMGTTLAATVEHWLRRHPASEAVLLAAKPLLLQAAVEVARQAHTDERVSKNPLLTPLVLRMEGSLNRVEEKLRSSAERFAARATATSTAASSGAARAEDRLSSSAGKVAEGGSNSGGGGGARKSGTRLSPISGLSLRGSSSTRESGRLTRVDHVFSNPTPLPAAPATAPGAASAGRRATNGKQPSSFNVALLPAANASVTVDALMAASHAEICALGLGNEAAILSELLGIPSSTLATEAMDALDVAMELSFGDLSALPLFPLFPPDPAARDLYRNYRQCYKNWALLRYAYQQRELFSFAVSGSAESARGFVAASVARSEADTPEAVMTPPMSPAPLRGSSSSGSSSSGGPGKWLDTEPTEHARSPMTTRKTPLLGRKTHRQEPVAPLQQPPVPVLGDKSSDDRSNDDKSNDDKSNEESSTCDNSASLNDASTYENSATADDDSDDDTDLPPLPALPADSSAAAPNEANASVPVLPPKPKSAVRKAHHRDRKAGGERAPRSTEDCRLPSPVKDAAAPALPPKPPKTSKRPPVAPPSTPVLSRSAAAPGSEHLAPQDEDECETSFLVKELLDEIFQEVDE